MEDGGAAGRSGDRPHGPQEMARWRAKPSGLLSDIAVDGDGSVVMRTDGSGRVGPASEADSRRPCHTLHGRIRPPRRGE